MRGQPFDGIAWEAFSAAAVVRYARCFSGGARQHLAHSLLDGAPAEVQGSHRHFIALRSKHVAHSVNELEENYVTITVRTEQGRPLEISGVSASHGRTLGIGLGEPRRLRELAQWVLGQVVQQVESERMAVLELARRVGVHEVVKGGVPAVGRAVDENAVHRTRSRP
jgi:hypothetical protein